MELGPPEETPEDFFWRLREANMVADRNCLIVSLEDGLLQRISKEKGYRWGWIPVGQLQQIISDQGGILKRHYTDDAPPIYTITFPDEVALISFVLKWS